MKQIAADNVVQYLVSRRSVTLPTADASVSELAGGVSGRCLLVTAGDRRLVVKQALEQLAVAADWTAKPQRAVTEAAALEFLHAITPEATPALIDVDSDLCAFTMTAAPTSYASWKDLLLLGKQRAAGISAVAGRLGVVLGRWHRQTWRDQQVALSFRDYEAFEQLRVSPFHRVIAACHPSVSGPVETCIDELLTGRDCLVHGDFSPKNVLVGPGAPWVVDFEVAHFGAAVFDLAFLCCHLMLKAVHQAGRAAAYRAAAAEFLAQYHATCPRPATGTRLAWHTACLMLARVDGKSPASYLAGGERDAVRGLAMKVLSGTDPELPDVWREIAGIRT